MQAHLLTPRLVSCLEAEENCTTTAAASAATPAFPFLSILVSGGHTILVHSKSLTEHKIMASSEDIAIGEALDKSAREIVPADILAGAESTMYGKTLERFVFPNGAADFAEYRAPRDRGEEVAGMKRASAYGWSVTVPFANTRALQLSFSSIASMAGKIVKARGEALDADLSRDERVELGREIMRVCFEHLGSRTVIALEQLRLTAREEIGTLVVSGGVAANRFLMAVLRSFLDERGFGGVRVVAPPPYLCTDNAAMVGWAGIEMFEAGWETDFSVRALRKWTLDSEAADGGVLGPGGWVKRDVLNLEA
jgi:N6-L-threonylcarbamoyladenine synthase